VAAHYRSHVEFSFEALDDAAAAFRRIEGYVERAAELTGGGDRAGQGAAPAGMLCADFAAAMDDDLGTPAAVAAIHDNVRQGNKLLADGSSAALRGNLGCVRTMLNLLGLDPLSPSWTTSSGGEQQGLRGALDLIVGALLQQRQEARERRDFAAADKVRDQLQAAGIEVADTPSGPRWTLEGRAP